MRPPVVLVVLAVLAAGCANDGGSGGNGGTVVGPDGLPTPAFDAPVKLSRPNAGGPEPVVAVASDGTLYVAAQDAPGGPPHFWASLDGGLSWREERPSTQSGGEVDMAAGPGGAVYFTQLGPQGNVVSVSHDKGQTWSTTPIQTLTTQYFDREWVAVDAQGSATLVARQFGTLGQETWAQASRSDDGGVTFVARGRAWDAASEPGQANGNLVASASGLLMPYVCRDVSAICAATSADRAQSWRQSLVVERSVRVDNVYPVGAADGSRLLVAWSDASDGRLAIWLSSSTDGGRSWSKAWKVSSDDETATMPWVASSQGRTWVAYLSTPKALTTADGQDAVGAPWSVVAARVDAQDERVEARGPALAEPAHVGVLSKPVGQGGGPFDRSFGDFFTIAVDGQGKLVIAVVRTTGGASDTLFIRES